MSFPAVPKSFKADINKDTDRRGARKAMERRSLRAPSRQPKMRIETPAGAVPFSRQARQATPKQVVGRLNADVEKQMQAQNILPQAPGRDGIMKRKMELQKQLDELNRQLGV